MPEGGTTGREPDGRTKVAFPPELPLLPVRDIVVLPYMMAPLVVSRATSLDAVEAAADGTREKLVLLAAQKDDREDPGPDEINAIGCVGMIVKLRRLSDGRVKILVQGLQRVRLDEIATGGPHLRARYTRLPDPPLGAAEALEADLLVKAAREALDRYAQAKSVAPELAFAASAADEPARLADLIAAALVLPLPDAQAMLEALEPLPRLRRVLGHLDRELELLEVRAKIETRAREELSRGQRESFLREQIRAIQRELGGGEGGSDLEELKARVAERNLPAEVLAEARKQLRRLEQLAAESAESSVIRGYLDWIVELPWPGNPGAATGGDFSMTKARAVLDCDHLGLGAVKDRILEHLAVLKLRGERARGSILCLAGPPGVGKTSLGRSVARALGRKFVRISLGGVRDEGEIRGHRRTYVGAMPGRILAGMKQAGVVDPVFMLDELDKLGHERQGDPSAALLEVLDPEQNASFRDHYLGLAYDLSRVMFVATANHAAAIPAALRDRLEIIEIPGYGEPQKLAIARRHLVPRQLERAGLDVGGLDFSPSALRRLVREYTREAGLRELERQIGRVCRKVARRVAEAGESGQVAAPRARVTGLSLERRLGPPTFPLDDQAPGATAGIGAAVGLAWTSWGGEVLSVEAQAVPGKGTLLLTGHMGEVMRESAHAALSWTRAHAGELGLADDFFANLEVHVHVPAGAVPKDGPSAGVTIAAAMVSLLCKAPAAAGVAMTGEITLRGHVLAVGGVREKLLAAARTPTLHTVVVPAGNLAELTSLPGHLRKRLRIVGAKTLEDLLAVAVPGASLKRTVRARRAES